MIPKSFEQRDSLGYYENSLVEIVVHDGSQAFIPKDLKFSPL